MFFESSRVADQQTPVGDALLCNSSPTEHPGSGALKILVLAQDLADVATQRRIATLCAGDAQVTAAGFRRAPQSVGNVAVAGQSISARPSMPDFYSASSP
jgi:hypothetical protein